MDVMLGLLCLIVFCVLAGLAVFAILRDRGAPASLAALACCAIMPLPFLIVLGIMWVVVRNGMLGFRG